jgi:amino acid transporter
VTGEHDQIKERYGLVRSFGLLQATALNMSNMVGIGPFITIPLLIAAMGGPQCMLGWAAGALLALCDGLVWSELAAAMPGSGGTYLYFREVFSKSRAGRLMPFLFIWQFIFSGPLEIASGYIGFAQYMSYLWRGMGVWEMRAVAAGGGLLIIALLYRNIQEVGKLTVVLWVGVLITLGWLVVSGLTQFNPSMAFDFPPDAFAFTRGFALGLGQATMLATYCFLGYYDICYIAGEVRSPERVIPRAIIFSVIAVACVHSVMTLSFMSVVPWREAINSKYIAAEFMERIYGGWGGTAITLMILWTSMASVFALVLGYSRVPYAAALDGLFFKPFAKLHPTGRFPHISLLTVGGLAILATMFTLDQVIAALMTARILAQFIGQIVAVHFLRKHRPDIERPFKMWLYPLPSLLAVLGWSYIFVTSGWQYVLYGLLTLVAGIAAFAVWDRMAARAAPQ